MIARLENREWLTENNNVFWPDITYPITTLNKNKFPYNTVSCIDFIHPSDLPLIMQNSTLFYIKFLSMTIVILLRHVSISTALLSIKATGMDIRLAT